MTATDTSRANGSTPVNPPKSTQLFDAAAIKSLKRHRVNPLPLLDPASLGMWLDQFEAGMLGQASQLWDAMCRRDDTLVTVKSQLENDVTSQDWGYHIVEGADEKEAERHRAALEFCYENLRARDAFDRNVRGGRDKLLEQMMQADSYQFAVHHLVWKPQPGRMIDVMRRDGKKMIKVDGAEPVPALTFFAEYVPLWFFENTTGELRLLRHGIGFGVDGEELDWESGEWLVTTGRGLMFAACICVTFKRLTFQDWTLFNERYAQNKVVGTTPSAAGSPPAESMRAVLEAFNSDNEILITDWQGDASKPPISLLGPEGTASVDVWEKFLDRQDRKMSAMYRGNDLSMMSRGGQGERPTGASLQGDEGEKMLRGACRRVADAAHEFITRKVIEFCFGAGVEPLAYFGLPDLAPEDVQNLRESAGFLADRGARVDLRDTAARLGVQLVPSEAPEEEILQPLKMPSATGDTKAAARQMTANGASRTGNASDPDLERFLAPYAQDFRKAFADDLQPLRSALEHVVSSPNSALQESNLNILRAMLPELLRTINQSPKTADVLHEVISQAMRRGWDQAAAQRTADLATENFQQVVDRHGAVGHWVTIDDNPVFIRDGGFTSSRTSSRTTAQPPQTQQPTTQPPPTTTQPPPTTAPVEPQKPATTAPVEQKPQANDAPLKFSTKADVENHFRSNFGANVGYQAPDGRGRVWGAKMSEARQLEHAAAVSKEFRRLKESYPDLKTSPNLTVLLVDPRRGRANRNGPSPFMSSATKDWTPAQYDAQEEWSRSNGGKLWGSTRRGTRVQDNFRHELAHTIHTPAVDAAWLPIWYKYGSSGFKTHVTEYGGKNHAEAFAESFTIATRPDYKSGTLPADVEHFIHERVLKGKI